jgi:hypothetical protein
MHVDVWLLEGYPLIVTDRGRLANRHWNVNQWLNATCSALRVRANLEAVAIDAPREGMPEGILNHAGQTIDRVLGKASLVEDYYTPIMIAS